VTGKRKLPKGWKWVKTVDVLDNSLKSPIRMGPFGSQLTKDELVDDGVFVLGIEHVLNKRFDDSGYKFINNEKFQQLKGFQIRPGDVLMTMMGTIGRTAVVPEGVRPTIISSHLLKMTVRKDVYPDFIAWVLSNLSPVYRQVHAESQGAIMQGLNTGIIKKLGFPFPSNFDEQVAIVRTLERKMANAQRIRQAALRQKEAAEALQGAILRDEFEAKRDNWYPTSISKIADITMGQSPDGDTYNKDGTGIPLLNGPTEFGPNNPTPVQWTNAAKKLGQVGDLLVCVRGNTTGKMNWADQVYCLGRGVASIRSEEHTSELQSP
jgi:type I restriction enzyme S subunit